MAINPATFAKEVRNELAKVVWPSRQQTIRLTAVVVILSIVVSFFIGGLDVALIKLMEILVRR